MPPIDPSLIAFRFTRRPPGWIFEAPAGYLNPPALIRQSAAESIPQGIVSGERPRGLVDVREIAQVCNTTLGEGPRPFYNSHPGIEHERALLVSTTDRLANLPENGRSSWQGQRDDDPSILRFFLVAESQILWCIEESWMYPLRRVWEPETAYAVLPDRLFEVA